MGTSVNQVSAYDSNEDHPHAYGDKKYPRSALPFLLGSSPRVWGQDSPRLNLSAISRIIPTRMGTSSYRRRLPQVSEDHPHAYGDKNNPGMRSEVARGSSPRVWGQAFAVRFAVLIIGIIPTRMGTSIGAKDEFISSEDHPHAYGDKFNGINK